jgi:hypothetical protein
MSAKQQKILEIIL